MIDYTLVVGVDARHLQQLAITWPTWKRHKPSLLQRPMLIFFDWNQVTPAMIFRAVQEHPNLVTVPWPEPDWIKHEGGDDKWTDPQRYRMLSGFVHVPATYVGTRYFLKIDTDTVATGQDDWIDEAWFENDPAIVAQGWGFTKPPDQMRKLDEWAYRNHHVLGFDSPPLSLDLKPEPGSDKLKHKRIISWCGFFNTEFTGRAADWAVRTCGQCQLPVPSQDGYLWYLAKRLGLGINRIDAKNRGWQHWNTMFNIRQAAERAMQC